MGSGVKVLASKLVRELPWTAGREVELDLKPVEYREVGLVANHREDRIHQNALAVAQRHLKETIPSPHGALDPCRFMERDGPVLGRRLIGLKYQLRAVREAIVRDNPNRWTLFSTNAPVDPRLRILSFQLR